MNNIGCAPEQFIDSLDSSFNMRPPSWLKEMIDGKSGIVILDLRPPGAFQAEHIEGSVNIQLKDLPSHYQRLEKHKDRDILCLCSGSVQSAYAIAYLYTRGRAAAPRSRISRMARGASCPL